MSRIPRGSSINHMHVKTEVQTLKETGEGLTRVGVRKKRGKGEHDFE